MTAALTSPDGLPPGLETGRHRVLHPGPLRWLRAIGWMLLLFILSMAANGLAEGPPSMVVLGKAGWASFAWVTAICVAALGVYALAVRLGENRWPEELSLKAAPLDLLIGIGVGVGMFSVVMLLLVLTGAYQVASPHLSDPLWALSMGLASGVTEELVIRAVIFRLIMRAFGVWPALTLSAALFGALHLFNPNATPMAAIAIAVEAGLMLAGFYLLSGRLWMSIAVHAAWNITQGYIFGAAVSGIAVPGSLLVSTPVTSRPEWLTGGAFGPEASAPAMLVGTLVAILTLVWAGRRGNLKSRADAPAIETAAV